MSDPEEHKFIQTKYAMGGRQGGGADEPKWNRVIFFFFFQYQKKWQSKCSFVAKSSSILHLDVCAQTLTHTHSDAITCTFNSDKRTEHDCDVFYNCFSENVLHFVFHGGEHRIKEFLKKKTINKKNIKK